MTFICNRLIISLPLTVLDASANQIELFPTSLSALTTLRELNLSSNHITTIPDQARLLYAAYHTLFYFFFFFLFLSLIIYSQYEPQGALSLVQPHRQDARGVGGGAARQHRVGARQREVRQS